MNYLDEWTFFPDLAAQEKQIHFYQYALLNPMEEGTVGAGLSHAYYKREALDALRRNLPIGTPTASVGYTYQYSFRNSLEKPSLPYYPLSV